MGIYSSTKNLFPLYNIRQLERPQHLGEFTGCRLQQRVIESRISLAWCKCQWHQYQERPYYNGYTRRKRPSDFCSSCQHAICCRLYLNDTTELIEMIMVPGCDGSCLTNYSPLPYFSSCATNRGEAWLSCNGRQKKEG